MLGAAAAAEAGDLFVLQLVSARLVWKERATVVELQAEEPGARLGGQPLVTRLRVSRKGGEAREVAQAAMTVWLRLPSWASRVEVRCTGALTALRPPAAGRLLPLRFAPAAESPRGELTLTLGVGVAWEPVSDRREQMRNLLQAPLYGPLVLVALTQGERALPFAAQLEPVPASARAQARARVRVRVRVRALTLTLTLTPTPTLTLTLKPNPKA